MVTLAFGTTLFINLGRISIIVKALEEKQLRQENYGKKSLSLKLKLTIN